MDTVESFRFLSWPSSIIILYRIQLTRPNAGCTSCIHFGRYVNMSVLSSNYISSDASAFSQHCWMSSEELRGKCGRPASVEDMYAPMAKRRLTPKGSWPFPVRTAPIWHLILRKTLLVDPCSSKWRSNSLCPTAITILNLLLSVRTSSCISAGASECVQLTCTCRRWKGHTNELSISMSVFLHPNSKFHSFGSAGNSSPCHYLLHYVILARTVDQQLKWKLPPLLYLNQSNQDVVEVQTLILNLRGLINIWHLIFGLTAVSSRAPTFWGAQQYSDKLTLL